MSCLAQIHYNSAGDSSTIAIFNDNNPRPWEFTLRPEECRTPMRCRYIIARAIQFICTKIEQESAQ